MSVNIDVDYLDAKTWDADMPARGTWLRENDPVHWSEKSNVWVVTRFEDVTAISNDQDRFTSGEGVRPQRDIKIGLIDEHEPRHTQLRNMLKRGFTPRMVKKLEDYFSGLTTDVLDKVAPRGRCDFVEEIAVPLPLFLIAHMIGIRAQDYQRFHEWSDAMIASDGNYDNAEIMAKSSAAFSEYSEYMSTVLDDRRANPQDDLVSILAGADARGELEKFDLHYEDTLATEQTNLEELELANSELMLLLVILLVAGNETTRNGMSGGMQLLIENPGERDKLLADPSLIPSAVEEMLRLVSPVLSFGRTVTRDTEYGGRKMKKGQQVLMLYGAANRDPAAFDEPDTFRVERNPHHLAFGIGSHFCLGANLARMEMRVLFDQLLRRMPDVAYADGGPRFSPSALVRSCSEMLIEYTPERGATVAGGVEEAASPA